MRRSLSIELHMVIAEQSLFYHAIDAWPSSEQKVERGALFPGLRVANPGYSY
ncbi:MAG TPA: hypothetical protein VM532_12260 [Burkholderiales bacterium]|nr:hypothetical protein [Burkholderiales bacterium]